MLLTFNGFQGSEKKTKERLDLSNYISDANKSVAMT